MPGMQGAQLSTFVVAWRARRRSLPARKVARAILPVSSALFTGRIARATAHLIPRPPPFLSAP